MGLLARKLGALFGGILLFLPLYVLLHEGGHALAALLCGARVTEFSLLGAHMSYEGGAFTPLTLSLFHLGGVLLPVLAEVLCLLAYRPRAGAIFCPVVSFQALLISVGPLCAWIIVPVLSLPGRAPRGDDAAKFLASSGLSPWAVLAGAALLLAGCLWLAWKRQVIQNYWSAVRREE